MARDRAFNAIERRGAELFKEWIGTLEPDDQVAVLRFVAEDRGHVSGRLLIESMRGRSKGEVGELFCCLVGMREDGTFNSRRWANLRSLNKEAREGSDAQGV